MKKYPFLITILLLASCAPSADQLQVALQKTLAAIPTATSYPTATAYPTYTIAPTQTAWMILITSTSSPTPLYTPTITPTPTKTLNPLQAQHDPGVYLVGVDIAPGVWRSTPGQDQCYWMTTTKTGDIIRNYLGASGGTMYIGSTDFQVEMRDACGEWTFMSNP